MDRSRKGDEQHQVMFSLTSSPLMTAWLSLYQVVCRAVKLQRKERPISLNGSYPSKSNNTESPKLLNRFMVVNLRLSFRDFASTSLGNCYYSPCSMSTMYLLVKVSIILMSPRGIQWMDKCEQERHSLWFRPSRLQIHRWVKWLLVIRGKLKWKCSHPPTTTKTEGRTQSKSVNKRSDGADRQ